MIATDFKARKILSVSVPQAEHLDAVVNGAVSKALTFHVPGDLSTGTKVRFTAPEAGTLVGVNVSLVTAGTTGAAIFDVHVGGTTVYTDQDNRPTIAIDGNDSSEAGAPEVAAFDAGDVFELIVDQADSGNTGAGATFTVNYTAA